MGTSVFMVITSLKIGMRRLFLSGRNPFPNGFIKVSAFKLTVSLHILVIRIVSLSLFHNFLVGCKESWCSNIISSAL